MCPAFQEDAIMDRKTIFTFIAVYSLVAGIGYFSQAESIETAPVAEESSSFIIEGESIEEVAAAVRAVGGQVTHELGIINAVAASVTAGQRAELRAIAGIMRITDDGAVTTAGGTAGGSPTSYAHFPSLVNADQVHANGNTGHSVTVAFLDSGMAAIAELQKDTTGKGRMQTRYNAITDREGRHNDNYGHGTHVASIMFNADYSDDGSMRRNSISPDVRVISVKAFNGKGNGTYADVIRGLDWILANKNRHNIGVLNLSFSAPARSHYWDDPINQAVMQLWQAGVVVVASAGNTGPDAMTIGVPGNNPYVITVGAMSDNYTPADPSDDVLASFSAAGPTVEGFVKPEVVAPGGHITARSRPTSTIAKQHPEFHDQGNYFTMSGTSQAAAVVSGIAALVIEANPGISNDDVKCRILASARPAVSDNGELAYSVFQQGAGMVDAMAAVYGTASGCANRGLDINLDITGQIHYGGRANVDENGNYYNMGLEGYLWTNGHLWTDGYPWTDR